MSVTNNDEFNLFVRATTSIFDVKVEIPSHIDINKSKFSVTSVAGSVDTAKVVHIHCSTLKSPYVLSAYSNKNDIIAICALSDVPSVVILDKTNLGMPLKVSHHCPCLRFYLTGEDYTELTGINSIEFQLCFFT